MDDEAFDEAVRAAYPGVTPLYMGRKRYWADGGPDPLDLIVIFPVDEPVPHWHLVSLGLTKDGPADDAGRGRDFELSMRAVRSPGEDEPPNWTLNRLQGIGQYVAESGSAVRAGQQMDDGRPIPDTSDGALEAWLFTVDATFDPLLPFDVVQVTAMTRDELQASRAWQADAWRPFMEEALGPELIIDPDRTSILDDPARAQQVADGIARDGSSTNALLTERLEVRPNRRFPPRPPRVTLHDTTAERLGWAVAGRLPHGHTLTIHDYAGTHVHLVPGDAVALNPSGGGHWELVLDSAAVRWLIDDLSTEPGLRRPDELAPLELDVRE